MPPLSRFSSCSRFCPRWRWRNFQIARDRVRSFPRAARQERPSTVELTGTDLDDLDRTAFHPCPASTAQPVMLPADEIWPEPRQDGLKFTVQNCRQRPSGEARSAQLRPIRTCLRPASFVVSTEGWKTGRIDRRRTATRRSETAASRSSSSRRSADSTTQQSLGSTTSCPCSKGQRVLVHVWGERIDSRIDGIGVGPRSLPGRRSPRRSTRSGSIPWVISPHQTDGDYIIKVSDYLFNGGPPYFYRLKATTAPHGSTACFSPGGKSRELARSSLVYGRNLPGGKPSGVTTANGDRARNQGSGNPRSPGRDNQCAR